MESNSKRRILFTGEASFLATGFSTYINEVMKRLHATGEFELAEQGSYAHDDDLRCQQVPWKFYPVAPARSNQQAMQKYASRPTNQFGEDKFTDVCLDFKPDIVISITDWWMSEYVERSPLRPNFSWVQMPTIDGEPQKPVWLDTYKRSDGILTYSDYGMNLLKKTGRRGTKLITKASPGVDLETFKPPDDKRAHKTRLGIDPNSLIVGMTARNQKRKLYYDLIEAFSMWLHQSKTKGHLELAKKTFLYLHTSYPDVGYDIGKAIRDFKVSNKVIMTYLCNNCQTAYPSFFAGELTICRKCGKLAAHPPNANHSCPRNVLADIMKTFDLYVQYSICEGSGMPPVEAMCCGVPVMAVDYSAMHDYFDCPTAIPIRVQRFFWEAIIETEQKRALPDNMDFVNKLDRFLKQNESKRIEKSQQTRNYAEELIETYGQDQKMPRYSWDRTAAIWGQVLRETKIKDQQTTWLCPTSRVHNPILTPPSNDMNNSEFVNWVIGKIWNRPDMLRTHFAGEWLKSLNSGSKTVGDKRIPFGRKEFVDHFMGMIQQSNVIEEKRLAILNRKTSDAVKVTVI
jgi:glycosyltransferase involved in cell wall biosynthesis